MRAFAVYVYRIFINGDTDMTKTKGKFHSGVTTVATGCNELSSCSVLLHPLRF